MTFYEKALTEYVAKKNIYVGLCFCSETFQKYWTNDNTKSKIKEHAVNFLKESSNYYFSVGSLSLFFTGSRNSRRERILGKKIRINFLKWCIKNKLDLDI